MTKKDSTEPIVTMPGNGGRPTRLPGSLSLVLPAHNEEANIEVVVRRALDVLPSYADDYEIIVVNDGSRDATPEIIDRLAQENPHVKPVHHPRNRGYGGALTSGFRASTGDYVMFMDADRQFDIADLGLLAPFVRKFDIVAGFRMERNDPLHRRVFAEIFNVTVRILFGVHLRDIDCAFKIFRGDLLRSIDLTAPGALINTEIQAKARRQGATIEQVGVHHYPRVAGEATGGSPKVILRAMGETLKLWWHMHGYKPPKSAKDPHGPHLLGDLFIGSAVAAMVGTIYAIGRKLFGRE
ncbi:MAG TPA: glycosyltransferase family 2 protein [Thermomicrobiales bacterium]|nr:glycosyltransferase family 2 protein [Thermomicrobiales bacterium]